MNKNIEFLYTNEPYKFISSLKNDDIKLFYSQNHHLQSSFNHYQRKIINTLKKDIKIIDVILFIWNRLLDSTLFYNEKENFFNKIINQKNKSLKFYDLFILDIITNYFFNNTNNIYIPITQSFISKNDPIEIYEILEDCTSLFEKKIYIVTDDLLWTNVFTPSVFHLAQRKEKNIQNINFTWVESHFDLFSYQILIPNKQFKIAGSSSNIFKLLNKNPNHKAIIDRDGFSRKNIAYLQEQFNLKFTITSECENIWLLESMLELMNSFSEKKLNIEKFKDDVILRAESNLDNVLNRFKNRQDYLMYQYIPYLNEEEIHMFKNKCLNHIKQKRYNKILNWFDNKKLFEFYLKESYNNDLNQWKKKIYKEKHVFNNLEMTLFI